MTRVRRVGLGGWLVEVASGEEAVSLHRHLAAAGRAPGVVDVVAGARTVLVDGMIERPVLDGLLAEWDPATPVPAGDTDVVELPVRYDGLDLPDVARLAGCEPDDVVAAHTGTEMSVAFCGFAPGFAYISGLPEPLRVARLDQPRTAVPAGSVAIAEEYTGVYPRRSPGGWRIIGHTDAALWDPARERPALLAPGTRVRFVSLG